MNGDVVMGTIWTPTAAYDVVPRQAEADAGGGTPCCSYAGYALFALEPRRRLSQAGLRLLVFPGTDMDYNANLDEVLDLPFVGLGVQKPGKFIEQTLPDRALSYLQPHISEERLTGMARQRRRGRVTKFLRNRSCLEIFA